MDRDSLVHRFPACAAFRPELAYAANGPNAFERLRGHSVPLPDALPGHALPVVSAPAQNEMGVASSIVKVLSGSQSGRDLTAMLIERRQLQVSDFVALVLLVVFTGVSR